MSFMTKHKKGIALLAAVSFFYLLQISVMPLKAEPAKGGDGTTVSSGTDSPGMVERMSVPKAKAEKKHFPWLLVLGGLVLIGGAVYLYLFVLQQFTLTVTTGEGVSGTPTSGSFKYKRGEKVSYSYSLQSGYKNLSVTLDGAAVAASGTIAMKAKHTLAASASQEYTLTVSVGTGVDGTPASGTYTYAKGQTVSYSYTLKSGYANLEVKVDGAAAAASGTITMNANHSLTATTSGQYKLTVILDDGVDGSPATGTYYYAAGQTVDYAFQPKSGYSNLVVFLDNFPINAIGTITMNQDHTLSANTRKLSK